jgi:hypothetical protein
VNLKRSLTSTGKIWLDGEESENLFVDIQPLAISDYLQQASNVIFPLPMPSILKKARRKSELIIAITFGKYSIQGGLWLLGQFKCGHHGD